MKQGGNACSPLSCFNGGICYTTLNDISKRNCAIPTHAGSECVLLEKNQAICVIYYISQVFNLISYYI